MLTLNIRLRLALMYYCIALRNEAILLPGEGGGGTFRGITWFSGGVEGEWGISRRQQSIKGG